VRCAASTRGCPALDCAAPARRQNKARMHKRTALLTHSKQPQCARRARASAGASGCELPSKAATALRHAARPQLTAAQHPRHAHARARSDAHRPLRRPGLHRLRHRRQASRRRFLERTSAGCFRGTAHGNGRQQGSTRVPGLARKLTRLPSARTKTSGPRQRCLVRDGRSGVDTKARGGAAARHAYETRLCCSVRIAGRAPGAAAACKLVWRRASAERSVPLKTYSREERCVRRSSDRRHKGVRTLSAAGAALRPRPYFHVAVRKIAAIAEAAALRRLKPARHASQRQSSSAARAEGDGGTASQARQAACGEARRVPGAEHRLRVIAVPFKHHRRGSEPR